MSHTLGPWHVKKWQGSFYIMPADENAEPIAIVTRWGKPDDTRLLAAAPELLAACEEFVRKVECGEARSTRSYAQMKAAIAKAKGEA